MRRRARGRIEIDGRREGDRDTAKHVGSELERSLKGAKKRETDKNGDRRTKKTLCQKCRH